MTVKGHVVSFASEFPNDNPELHRGVVWTCTETRGAVSPRIHVEETPMAFEIETEQQQVQAARESGIQLAAPRSDEQRAEDLRSLDELFAMAAFDPDADEDGEPILIEELEAFSFEDEDADAPAVNEAGAAVVGTALNESAVPAVPAELASRTPFHEFVEALVDVVQAEASADLARALSDTLHAGALVGELPEGTERALVRGNITTGGALSPTFSESLRAWRAILDGTSEDLAACGASMLDEWAAELVARWMNVEAHAPALRRSLRERGVAAFGLTLVA